jgi:hypothetical protein
MQCNFNYSFSSTILPKGLFKWYVRLFCHIFVILTHPHDTFCLIFVILAPHVSFGDTYMDIPLWRDTFHIAKYKFKFFLDCSKKETFVQIGRKCHMTHWLTPSITHVLFGDTVATPSPRVSRFIWMAPNCNWNFVIQTNISSNFSVYANCLNVKYFQNLSVAYNDGYQYYIKTWQM